MLEAPALLSPEHQVDGFISGATSLDEWLKRRARANQISGASRTYVVAEAGRVMGEKIILVDDVYTTGSTVKECALTLMKNKAESVSVLTLARTI